MKLLVLFIFSTLLSLSCNDKNDVELPGGLPLAQRVCGNDVAWLSDIIAKAEEDKATRKYQGTYVGTIYLITYKNSPAFLIDMSLGSGGIAYYLFDCNKQGIYPATVNGQIPTLYAEAVANGKIIYSNVP